MPTLSRRALHSAALILVILLAIVPNAPAVHAGILWVDAHHESIVLPLESPSLGLARARYYLENGQPRRAAQALRKLIGKYPNAQAARDLLAELEAREGTSAPRPHDADRS